MDFEQHRDEKSYQEAVLVYLDATDLPEEFWELNKRLFEELEQSGAGEFDGNEIGGGEAMLFAYGPDASRLFSAMEPILRSYTLCHNARCILRRGGPGSQEIEVKLSAS